ncbi:hypothetical protein OIV83_004226 [Microbotryomycetes sp. JL201]|nr:hypothetical protein OIV83_004226 [Microbotryomycetes sp. JL201]
MVTSYAYESLTVQDGSALEAGRTCSPDVGVERRWTRLSSSNALKLTVACVLVAVVVVTIHKLDYIKDIVAAGLQSLLAASGWGMISSRTPHTTAKCVLIQEGGMNDGGYGDQVRLTHRAEFMAQVLGCDYLRTFKSSTHGYVGSNLFANVSTDVSLSGLRTCNVDQVLDVISIEGRDTDCDPEMIGDPSECDIFTYAPKTRIYGTNKLACVADRLRDKLNVSITRSWPGCAEGYGAIHYRYGDVGKSAIDFRTLSVGELDAAISQIKQRYSFRDDCVVVFAESYPHRRINGTMQGHVVDNRTDPVRAMGDMAGATVLYAGASGFMLPVVLLFDGQEIIVSPGYLPRFQGLPRAGVELTESSFDNTKA